MGRKSTPPAPLDAATSARLARQPRTATKPEIALRRELHRRGLRFRVDHPGLPGRPDIAFTRAMVAVFVDGCFWHRCPEHGTMPRNNREWWQAKLDRNVVRDRAKDAALAELGWLAVHVWEHEPVIDAAERVESVWRERIMTRSAGNRFARTAPRGPGTD
ncbi:very short patch repair endonuclease [Plantactinospora siamensis]|uniref:Very short patch repair endonuclease n=1 Tax=Plantactinospora siamensis TaxID=555372 RepID=A0ABV6NPG1_9ACTN